MIGRGCGGGFAVTSPPSNGKRGLMKGLGRRGMKWMGETRRRWRGVGSEVTYKMENGQGPASEAHTRREMASTKGGKATFTEGEERPMAWR